MSRQIDITKPLSDEDREYLESRGRNDLLAMADQNFAAPNDNDLGHQSPSAVPASLGENQAAGLVPTLTPQTGLSADQGPGVADGADSTDDPADNYDEASVWSHEDLKTEVKERKETGAEDAPALNSSREVLVAWLREDDKRPVVEDGDPQPPQH